MKNSKDENIAEENLATKESIKRPYSKPELISEKLNAYGASCNGSSTGGRKASTSSPSFCNSRKLNS
jgi:hypothetical protein